MRLSLSLSLPLSLSLMLLLVVFLQLNCGHNVQDGDAGGGDGGLRLWGVHAESFGAYLDRRSALILEEESMGIYNNASTSALESKVNDILQVLMDNDTTTAIEVNLAGNGNLPAQQNFFLTRSFVEESPLYSILQAFPKGSILHLHSNTILDPTWLVYNVSYRSDVWWLPSSPSAPNGLLQFSSVQPDPLDYTRRPSRGYTSSTQAGDDNDGWVLLSQYRAGLSNVSQFDEAMLVNMTISTTSTSPDYFGDAIWIAFQAAISLQNGLTGYLPVFREYYYEQALPAYFLGDNLQHIEFRHVPGGLYTSNVSEPISPEEEASVLNEIAANVTASLAAYAARNSREYGVGKGGGVGVGNSYNMNATIQFIWCALRFQTPDVVYQTGLDALAAHLKYPDVNVGFDLVGEESLGTLLYYVPVLMKLQQQANNASASGSDGSGFRFYFHAGETTNFTNLNLFDAIGMNTTRIGHGFALAHHPLLMNMAQAMNIGIEVCPISNQVLHLVANLQDHPIAVMFSQTLAEQVTLSPDDPGIVGITGVSYDWYMALTAFRLNVDAMRQLAVNSLQQSTPFKYSATQLKLAMLEWGDRYNVWLQWVANEYS